jgi:hypothetical protein
MQVIYHHTCALVASQRDSATSLAHVDPALLPYNISSFPARFTVRRELDSSGLPLQTRSYHMQAVVFHGIGDIRLEQVPDPTIQQPTDAIIRITSNAICGTDLHMVRGTAAPMKPGTILGHEDVGMVEEIGANVSVICGPTTAYWCYPRSVVEVLLTAYMLLLMTHYTSAMARTEEKITGSSRV